MVAWTFLHPQSLFCNQSIYVNHYFLLQVNPKQPPVYYLRDSDNNVLLGGFYEQELQLTKFKDVFLISEIVARSKNRLKVKFLGYEKPEWINKKDILDDN